MSLFDDGFDVEDATILGGAMGFAEESMKAEEESPEEISEEEIEVDLSEIKDTDLRLIHNMNPSLFRYIINIIQKQRAKWERDRLDRESVREELIALEESEKCLEELEVNDDN
jgi:hypothetical protein